MGYDNATDLLHAYAGGAISASAAIRWLIAHPESHQEARLTLGLWEIRAGRLDGDWSEIYAGLASATTEAGEILRERLRL